MPELPEVETVKNSLESFIKGKKIISLKILREKSFPQPERKKIILGQEIISLHRRAKYLDLVLANNYHLLTHLKMTGQLLYVHKKQLAGGGHPTADVLQQLPGKHTRLIYQLDDGSHLYFNDMRVFGWMKVLSPKELEKEYAKLGPDANASTFTSAYLYKALQRKSQPIKQVLMDNRICCGLGNIYVAETLFQAGIDPRRGAKSLSLTEIKKVVKEAKKILQKAIKHRGTTFDGRYVDSTGKGGSFEKFLQVYGREGKPCKKCQLKLQNVRLGGRSTCFCPHCQT